MASSAARPSRPLGDLLPAALRQNLQRDKVEAFGRHPFGELALRAPDRLEMHPKLTFFLGGWSSDSQHVPNPPLQRRPRAESPQRLRRPSHKP